MKTKIGIFSAEETITRPVIIKVTEDIIRFLGMNHDIYYTMDENELVDRIKNPLGQIESYSSPQTEHILIDYDEELSDGYDISLQIRRPDYRAIYTDEEIDASIIPIHLKRRMTINFKYVNKSRSKVSALINKLRTLPSSDGQYIVHDLEYHYVLPTIIFDLVNEINTKKNNKLDAPVEITDYINNTFDLGITTVNPVDGDSYKVDLAVRVEQESVMGWIEGNIGDIKKNKIDEENAWSVEFSYVFEYETPVELLVKYPIVVYNQLIDKRFREVIPKTEFKYKGNFTSGSQALMDINSSTYSDTFKLVNNYYLSIPKEDTFKLPKPYPNYARLMSVLTLVDDNDPTLLFNVMDIPDITFKQEILDFWKESDYPYVGIPYQSIFYFELYKNGVRDYDNSVTMDENLNLRSMYPLDNKSLYRVTINALTDLNLLKHSDYVRIEEYVKSKYPIGEVPPLVEYYAGIFNIPSSILPTHNNDISVLLKITDNSWVKFYTQQEYVTLTSVLEPK